MSQENVEIVRAALDAANRGDLDGMLRDAAPGFEFDFSRAVGPQHGVFGRDEMPGLFKEFDGPWGSVRREADEFIEGGEQVVTPLTSYHRRPDGMELRARIALVWTFDDGAITRVCFYQTRDEALEAAGL
jgi:ketosteroid isomerase-like protein